LSFLARQRRARVRVGGAPVGARSVGTLRRVCLLLLVVGLSSASAADDPDGNLHALAPDWTSVPSAPFPLAPADIANPVLMAGDVTDVPARFVADPFLMRAAGTWYLFCEVYDETAGHGKIGLATSVDGAHWDYDRIVLAESWHLSYPFVFEYDGEYYMLPESGATREVRLYRAKEFPYGWSHVATLASGRPFVDPTLIRHDDTWWLLVASDNSASCWLYYADDLMGPWTEHPQSPIATGRASSRPAGRSLVYGGDRIIRLTQKCDITYGEAVRAFEVDRLTRTEYREHELPGSPVLSPGDGGWPRTGMHHCDPWWAGDHWIAAVDGLTNGKWTIGICCGTADSYCAKGSGGGNGTASGGIVEFDNPFVPGGAIAFAARRGGGAIPMWLGVCDVEGRVVRVLYDGSSSSEWRRMMWDGLDDHGRPVGSGAYVMRLLAGGADSHRRLILVR
jgi:hypothetical protein